MDQVVGMMEAKSKLAELMGEVKYGGKRFISVCLSPREAWAKRHMSGREQQFIQETFASRWIAPLGQA